MPKFSKELKQEANKFLAENLLGQGGEESELHKPPNYIEDYHLVLEWLSSEEEVVHVELIEGEKGKSKCKLTYLVDGNDYEYCKKMFSSLLDEPFELQCWFEGDTIGEAICLAAVYHLHEVKGID